MEEVKQRLVARDYFRKTGKVRVHQTRNVLNLFVYLLHNLKLRITHGPVLEFAMVNICIWQKFPWTRRVQTRTLSVDSSPSSAHHLCLAFFVFGTATLSSLRSSVAVRSIDASWTVSTSDSHFSFGPRCSRNVCKSPIATVMTSWLA